MKSSQLGLRGDTCMKNWLLIYDSGPLLLQIEWNHRGDIPFDVQGYKKITAGLIKTEFDSNVLTVLTCKTRPFFKVTEILVDTCCMKMDCFVDIQEKYPRTFKNIQEYPKTNHPRKHCRMVLPANPTIHLQGILQDDNYWDHITVHRIIVEFVSGASTCTCHISWGNIYSSNVPNLIKIACLLFFFFRISWFCDWPPSKKKRWPVCSPRNRK